MCTPIFKVTQVNLSQCLISPEPLFFLDCYTFYHLKYQTQEEFLPLPTKIIALLNWDLNDSMITDFLNTNNNYDHFFNKLLNILDKYKICLRSCYLMSCGF